MTFSTAEESVAPRGVLIHTLLLATAAQIVATCSVLALTALAPAVAVGVGLDAHFIGYQVSVIYAAGMVTSAIAGNLVQRFGGAWVEVVALSCFALGFIGLASASTPLMLAATLVIGCGYGLNNPAASEMLTPVTPARLRNLVFSFKQSGVPLGGVAASAVLPVLEMHVGWRAGLALAAAAPVAVGIWLVATHAGHTPPAGVRRGFGRGIIEEQAHIWKDHGLRVLSLLGLVYSALQLSVSAFMVVALVHDAGWGVLAAGGLAASTQLAGAFGRIGWGIVADRLGGEFRTLALIGLISGLACLPLPMLSSLAFPAQMGVFLLLGGSSIGWNGVFLAAVARHAPAGRVGAATGAVLVYTFIGVIVGPSGFAALYSVIGNYGGAFAVFSAFGLVGAVMSFLAHRRQLRSGMARPGTAP
ncbi:MAG: MFS transporter [Rhizobium sp.]